MLIYLIRATFTGALMYPPLALIAWPALAIGIVMRCAAIETPFKAKELLVFIPLLFTAALIAFGTIFYLPRGISDEIWREIIPLGILVNQLVVSAEIVRLLRDIRVAAAGILLFLFCLSAMAAFEASMAVTNAWL